MFCSLTRARWLVLFAMFILGPLSASAQETVSCGPWTDNPIVAGSTSLKAQHLNEIRACLDLIVRILNVAPPPPPPPPSGAIELTDVLKYNPCFTTRICIYVTVVNGTSESIQFDVWTRIYDNADQLLELEQTRRITVAGGGQRQVGIVDVDIEDMTTAAYYTVELTTTDGVSLPCSGCGTRRPW